MFTLEEIWKAGRDNCSSCDGDDSCKCWLCETARIGIRERDQANERAALAQK